MDIKFDCAIFPVEKHLVRKTKLVSLNLPFLLALSNDGDCSISCYKTTFLEDWKILTMQARSETKMPQADEPEAAKTTI